MVAQLKQDERLAPGFGRDDLEQVLADHPKAKNIMLVGHEPDFPDHQCVDRRGQGHSQEGQPDASGYHRHRSPAGEPGMVVTAKEHATLE